MIIGPVVPEEIYMVVGNGRDGKYVCNVAADTDREFALIDPSKPSDQYANVLVGQTTVRALNEIVDLVTVLTAAQTYAEHGTLDERLSWRLV